MSVSIKVAVRCRPFTVEDKLGVEMEQHKEEEGEVTLLNSNYTTKRFGFTYSWWSAYGWQRRCQSDKDIAERMKLVSNNDVYDSVGQKIKADLMGGNAVVLFAYGLSGSGKTFTVFGPDAADIPEAWFKHDEPHDMWGIFPHLAYDIFKQKTDGWKVSMKYFQNVVDTVRDLMSATAKEQAYKSGMKKDKDGFTDVTWCKSKILNDWNHLRSTFLEANGRKAIAPTQFNHQSTRGHCVMTLDVEMPVPGAEGLKQKGRVYVCDLAGTEPAADIVYAQYKKVVHDDGTVDHDYKGPHPDAGKSKELQDQGKKINLSLSEMAQFFMKMAQAVKKKTLKPGMSIPGCNSYFLCKYLKDTMLQARTYLFCAIRPEVKYHSYTYSTLTFAKNASVIKLQPKKTTAKQSPAEAKLLRELDEMKALVESFRSEAAKQQNSDEKIAELQKALQQKQQALADEGKSEEESAATAKEEEELKNQRDDYAKRGILLYHFDSNTALPYLINVDEDPFRSRRYMYAFEKDTTVFGPRQDVQLASLTLVPDHCSVTKSADGGSVELKAGDGDVFHNGIRLTQQQTVTLAPLDRVVIASELMMFHWATKEKEAGDSADGAATAATMSAEDCVAEFRQGLMTSAGGGDAEDLAKQKEQFEAMKKEFEKNRRLHVEAHGAPHKDHHHGEHVQFSKEEAMRAVDREIMETLPRINDMKKICRFLNRGMLVFATNLQRSDKSGVPKVQVRVTNGDTDESIFLDTFEFIKAHSILKDELMNLKTAISNERKYDCPKEHDPITLLFDCSFHLGTATVFMMDLSYMLETDDEETQKDIKYAITPFNNIGKLHVRWVPLAGPEDEGEDPELIPELEGDELIGNPWSYRLEIKGAIGLPVQTDLAYCQYQFFGETYVTESVEQKTRSPEFDYKFVHHVDRVTPEFLEYLQSEAMSIDVFVVPTVQKAQDRISTKNAMVLAAIEGRSAQVAGARVGAPVLDIRQIASNRLGLAKAEAAIYTQVASKMEAKECGCEIALRAKDSVASNAEVQQLIVKRLQLANPDWPKIKLANQKLQLQWVKSWESK